MGGGGGEGEGIGELGGGRQGWSGGSGQGGRGLALKQQRSVRSGVVMVGKGKGEEVAVRAGRVFTDAAPLLLGSAD